VTFENMRVHYEYALRSFPRLLDVGRKGRSSKPNLLKQGQSNVRNRLNQFCNTNFTQNTAFANLGLQLSRLQRRKWSPFKNEGRLSSVLRAVPPDDSCQTIWQALQCESVIRPNLVNVDQLCNFSVSRRRFRPRARPS